MTYTQWFDAHALKHAVIMKKLTHLSDVEVIEYFRFENMVINEPSFCLLYADNKKCHEIEQLNCYWCACPYFRFNDLGLEVIEARTLYSTCSIESKEGSQFVSEKSIHQDCTGCLIPHHEKILQKEFNRDWRVAMSKVTRQSIYP